MKSLVWTYQPFQRKIRQNFFDSELNNLKALEVALGLKVGMRFLYSHRKDLRQQISNLFLGGCWTCNATWISPLQNRLLLLFRKYMRISLIPTRILYDFAIFSYGCNLSDHLCLC